MLNMTNAQDLLTLMAEVLMTGSVALYGSLFVHGLIMRHRRPRRVAQMAQPVQPIQPVQPVQVAEPVSTITQPADVAEADAVTDPIAALRTLPILTLALTGYVSLLWTEALIEIERVDQIKLAIADLNKERVMLADLSPKSRKRTKGSRLARTSSR